jgi:hypothetical protein
MDIEQITIEEWLLYALAYNMGYDVRGGGVK